MKKRKLKILQFICPAGFYGAERWVLALGNNSDTKLVQQNLVVTRDPGQSEIELLKHYRQIKDVNCHEIVASSRFDWSTVRALVEVIRKQNIDIIHTHGYKSDIIGVIAAKVAGIKSVSSPHGFGEIQGFKMKLFVKLGCFSFRFFNWVVPLSEELFNDVLNRGCPEHKLVLIKNGVDLKEVEMVRDTVLVEKLYKNEIGYIGRLSPGKQVDQIIRAFYSLYKENSELNLTIVGDGPCRQELEALTHTLGCNENVHFLGFRDDRLELLKRFDAFVLASKAEGIPRCLMESMGMGIPIVAYDIKGVDQLISHGSTGSLAPLDDERELARQIEKLLLDQSFAVGIAARAKAFVEEEFSAARMSQQYLELYYRMLNMA